MAVIVTGEYVNDLWQEYCFYILICIIILDRRIAEQWLGGTGKWQVFLAEVIRMQSQAAEVVAVTSPILLVIMHNMLLDKEYFTLRRWL